MDPGAEFGLWDGFVSRRLRDGSKGSVSVIELYGRVFDRMYDALDGTGLDQEPELRVIRAAGHESEGDFFFVAN